jgi:hypothetical protein
VGGDASFTQASTNATNLLMDAIGEAAEKPWLAPGREGASPFSSKGVFHIA